MTISSPKRFNAQRAARRELGNPEAQEGVDFITAKNAEGHWVVTIPARAALLRDGCTEAEADLELAVGHGDHSPQPLAAADEPVVTRPEVQARMQAEFEAAPAANEPAVHIDDLHASEEPAAEANRASWDAATTKAPRKAAVQGTEPRANKSAAVVAKAASREGITNAEIREMTGWTKLGGFFGAVKRKGYVLRRVRENGDTRWFAEPAKSEAA